MTHDSIRWSESLAYAVGLIATDGCLYKDGRHIALVSKDIEQLENFIKCLEIKNKISKHSGSGYSKGIYYRVQFSNINYYRFFLKIGLTPAKTKTIGPLKIPDRFFADFLRGHLDGDGSTYSYFDPRWKNSFMLYTSFSSASEKHLIWIKEQIQL